MEFILNKIDINNYRGNIIFYWLERNITFNYNVDKFKQIGDKSILKLDYKLPGKYRLGHNLQNKQTNLYDDIEIDIHSKGILELRGGKMKRLEWIYFIINEIVENDIIIDKYDKDKFRNEENDIKSRTHKMNIEYWNSYWKCLHLISILYPNEPKINMKLSLERLLLKLKGNGLTCDNCRKHYIRYLSNNKIEKIVSNKEKTIKFFLGLHNDVNKRNNKREWTKLEVKEFYKDTEKINREILDNYKLDIKNLLESNEIDKFPDIYNNKGRECMKRKWGLFILEK